MKRLPSSLPTLLSLRSARAGCLDNARPGCLLKVGCVGAASTAQMTTHDKFHRLAELDTMRVEASGMPQTTRRKTKIGPACGRARACSSSWRRIATPSCSRRYSL
eukprot:6212471-Pleurochrysis_carterae.AAC.1